MWTAVELWANAQWVQFKHKQMMEKLNHTGSDGEKKNSTERKRDRHVLRQQAELLWRRGGRNYEQIFPLGFCFFTLETVFCNF